MLEREINLLPEETAEKKVREKRVKTSIFTLTSGVIIFGLVLILGVIFYGYYLTRQASSLKEKISREEQKIGRQKEKEYLLLATKLKILSLQKILATRPLYENQLKSFDLTGRLFSDSGFILTDYSFKNKEASFAVLAPTSDALEKFVESLLKENSEEGLFKEIKIKSLDLQREKETNFTFYKLSFTVEVSE